MAMLTKRANGDSLRERVVAPQRGFEFGTDPFNDLARTMRRMSSYFSATGIPTMESLDAIAFPPIEVYEKDGSYVIDAAVPGFKRDEIEIECTDNRCTISGSSERQAYEERLKDKVHQSELQRREFARTIALPKDIDCDRVSAKLQDGMLTITLPMVAPSTAKKIAISA